MTPVSSDKRAECREKENVKVSKGLAKGRRGRIFPFYGAVFSLFLVRAVWPTAIKMTRLLLCIWSNEMYYPVYVKSKKLLLGDLGESSYYSRAFLSTYPQGWLPLRGPRSCTHAPGPCQAVWSCVCLKTRLNPPQQLSQIRSQFSKGEAKRAAGADCRADVAITESMERLKMKISVVE